MPVDVCHPHEFCAHGSRLHGTGIAVGIPNRCSLHCLELVEVWKVVRPIFVHPDSHAGGQSRSGKHELSHAQAAQYSSVLKSDDHSMQ